MQRLPVGGKGATDLAGKGERVGHQPVELRRDAFDAVGADRVSTKLLELDIAPSREVVVGFLPLRRHVESALGVDPVSGSQFGAGFGGEDLEVDSVLVVNFRPFTGSVDGSSVAHAVSGEQRAESERESGELHR